MIRLTRSEPSRDMHRFYTLQLAPTLFGEWALVAEWCRIGPSGKVMHAVFETEELAQIAFEKCLKRAWYLVHGTLPRDSRSDSVRISHQPGLRPVERCSGRLTSPTAPGERSSDGTPTSLSLLRSRFNRQDNRRRVCA